MRSVTELYNKLPEKLQKKLQTVAQGATWVSVSQVIAGLAAIGVLLGMMRSGAFSWDDVRLGMVAAGSATVIGLPLTLLLALRDPPEGKKQWSGCINPSHTAYRDLSDDDKL